MDVKPKAGEVIEEGESVYTNQVEEIRHIRLHDDEYDHGHVTFVRTDKGWHGRFDFIYNKGLSSKHVAVAKQFIEAAEDSRRKQNWIAFVDILFRAAELAAKAILFSLDGPDITKTKKHNTIHARFNKQGHLGNADTKHTKTLNSLWKLRQDRSYVQNNIRLTDEVAQEHISIVQEMIDMATKWSSDSYWV